MEQKVLRTGAWVVACAIALRLLSTRVDSFRVQVSPRLISYMIFMQTGRVVRAQAQEEQPTVGETTVAAAPPAAVFDGEAAECVQLFESSGWKVDLQALISQSLEWDLTEDAPQVLILHTHATESYTKDGAQYQEVAAFRTLDEQHNMLRVGEALAETLRAWDIQVIHDTTLHDYPSYTGSYNNSRKTAQKYLEEYPSIKLVLDIHRDAVELTGGRQMDTSATVDGQEAAQLMLVVGTNAGGLTHPQWQENLALALKLHVQLEQENPGIMRPLYLRTERFNQDLLPGALLVEVGAAGNTLEEALRAARALGRAIGALRYGANRE